VVARWGATSSCSLAFSLSFASKVLYGRPPSLHLSADDVLSTIQAIVFSHGHTDHTGGMTGLLDKLGRRRLPILLHPDAFLKRRMVINEMLVLDLPPPSLHDLQCEGIELLVERGPSFLLNGKILPTPKLVAPNCRFWPISFDVL
jgi:hypothetical protein